MGARTSRVVREGRMPVNMGRVIMPFSARLAVIEGPWLQLQLGYMACRRHGVPLWTLPLSSIELVVLDEVCIASTAALSCRKARMTCSCQNK